MNITEERYALIEHADTFVPFLEEEIANNPNISEDDLENMLREWIRWEISEFNASKMYDEAKSLEKDMEIVVYDAMEILRDKRRGETS